MKVPLDLDQDGHLQDPTSWDEQSAAQLAQALGVTLTPVHWQILSATRQFYADFDHIPRTRPFVKYLQSALPELKLTNAELQKLFNTGVTVREIARVAGLPKPAHCL